MEKVTPTNRRLTIRRATGEDAAAVAQICNYYVAETVITFEVDSVAPAEMASRMEAVERHSLPWLVAEREGEVVGYAYATAWKPRAAYQFSVEATIYLDHRHTGRGIGSTLYRELLALLRGRGIHAVLGGIALPNATSVALHEKFGFQQVAHFREDRLQVRPLDRCRLLGTPPSPGMISS